MVAVDVYAVYTSGMSRESVRVVLFGFCLFLVVSLLSVHAPEEKEVGGMSFVPNVVVTKREGESILFLGDVMLGRHVEQLMSENGTEYPFLAIRNALSSSTFVVANLEGSIPEKHLPTPSGGFRFSFIQEVAKTLNTVGVDAVSLANNHASDFGEEGWKSTVAILSSSNVASFGHSRRVATSSYDVEVDGVAVSVFGINVITPTWDKVKALATVDEVCRTKEGAYVVAFLHFGEEYEHLQSGRQDNLVNELFSRCVNLVIGAHPHVVQGVRESEGKIAVFSLGNFIFDQYFSAATQQGLMARLTFVDGQPKIELIPVVSERSQPRLAQGNERMAILTLIRNNSPSHLAEKIMTGTLHGRR